MLSRKTVLIAAIFFASFVFVALVVGEDDDWEPPEPEIESVELIRSGCHDDVRAIGASSTDGMWIRTINGTSPHTDVSAQIRLVSAERADVTAYRVDVETHNTSAPAPDHDCDGDGGAIVYRVEYDAPSDEAADGLRVERFLNGELVGCGGSTSDPELGCARLHEDVPTSWSNESA